jgi:uncharacterized membrane protein/protein-disulfide isomerase
MENTNNNLKKTIKITSLVILGLLITIDLAFIYYQANFNEFALPSFCSVSEFIDCDGVARTTESQFLGVPLAYWGLFLYAFILMLLFVDKLKQIKLFKFLEVFKNKFHYIASLGILAFCISMILLGVSLFEIQKLCVMCAITYMINLCIGLVALEDIEGGIVGAVKQSWKDFVDALKPIPYRIAFTAVMLIACGFLGWTYNSATFSPALRVQKAYGEFMNAKTNKYAITGNVLGSDAKDAIVINIYSDYMCPMCNICNMMLHKIAKEFENVRIEHHTMPLDTACNKYMTQEFHHGSCTMAQYAEAALLQGKFWEVNSLFFEKKPSTEDDVIDVLKKSNFNLDLDKLQNDAHSTEVNNIIQEDIETMIKHKMIGTPVLQIGDSFEMGIPKGGYPALKQKVIDNGGKLKHKLF